MDVQDSETGFTPLHAAIAACETEEEGANDKIGCNLRGSSDVHNGYPASTNGMSSQQELIERGRETIKCLLENGAIWNQLDKNNETPGCIAYRIGLIELYSLMVDAGVRAEVLLNRLEEYERLEDEDEEEEDDVSPPGTTNPEQSTEEARATEEVNTEIYLSSTLSLSGDKLLDDRQNGVMMSWETDIMAKSADAILTQGGLRILNIGFGMGVIDTCIQSHHNKPSSHHIVEAHPMVLADMDRQGWREKPSVVIHEGKWQDVLPRLVAGGQMFDAIYFDTFAESYSQFRDFFSEQVIGLLEQHGKFGFFNGMGADRQISYDVYQKVVELDLFEAGLDVCWQEIEVPQLEGQWEGVKRRYWNIDSYRLPVCRFMD